MSRSGATARSIDRCPCHWAKGRSRNAHFDKGVLHLTIKKPAKAIKTTKTIDIKTGAPPTIRAATKKAA